MSSSIANSTTLPPNTTTTGWGVSLPETVDGLRYFLYLFECLFGTIAIIIILIMWNCLGRIAKINKNLDFVIKNAAVAMIVICLTRYFLIASQIYQVLSYFQKYFVSAIHDIAMAHIGDIQLTLLFERIYATNHAKTYELNSQTFFYKIFLMSSFVWFLSFLRILCFYKSWLKPYDVNFVCVGLTVAAALIHTYLFYKNRQNYIKPKTHVLSERYQLAENIQIHYSLIVFTIISFLHNCTILSCRFVIQEVITPQRLQYEYALVDHAWNTSTAMYFCLYPIAFIVQDKQIQIWIKRILDSPKVALHKARVTPVSPGPVVSIRSVIGKELVVNDESNAYFHQLQAAWK